MHDSDAEMRECELQGRIYRLNALAPARDYGPLEGLIPRGQFVVHLVFVRQPGRAHDGVLKARCSG